MKWCSLNTPIGLTQEESYFLATLVQETSHTGKYLIVGASSGEALCRMMMCFPRHQCPEFVVVDPMVSFANQLQSIHSKLESHQLNLKKVDFRQVTSQVAIQEAAAKGESFDFILIESVPKIRYLMQCLQWTRLLKVGGILCLHSYPSMDRSAWLTIHRFVKKHKNYQLMQHVGKLLAVKKTGKSNFKEISLSDHLFALGFSPFLHLEHIIRNQLKK